MNYKKQKFFTNSSKNITKPPWYINCTRPEAEAILTDYREYGNVLIRPKSDSDAGHCALSSTSRGSSGTKFVHYAISSTPSGYKLEINNSPAPMACLKDVIDYYVNAAGYQTHQAMALDPTEPKTECQRRDKSRDYVNMPMPTSRPVSDELYLKMNGNARKQSPVQRTCSNPVAPRDYVNIPKALGHDSAIYLNPSETELFCPASTSRDYVNMPNAKQRLYQNSKADSFPPYGKEADEGRGDSDNDEDRYLKPCQYENNILP